MVNLMIDRTAGRSDAHRSWWGMEAELSNEALLIEHHGSVLSLVLNRLEQRNAIDGTTYAAIGAAMDQAEADLQSGFSPSPHPASTSAQRLIWSSCTACLRPPARAVPVPFL